VREDPSKYADIRLGEWEIDANIRVHSSLMSIFGFPDIAHGATMMAQLLCVGF